MKRQGATSTIPAHKHGVREIAIVLAVIGLTAMWASLCLAQVPPITPSGLNTQVSPPSNLPSGKVQYDITGGTRPGAGPNLFHSFGNFNVPNNSIANFLNDSGLPTSNILGRVTGGNVSNIFGMIQTTNFGNANLFLMNPAGFLFGPNATLNVGGMVAFTSADYLRLQGGPNDIFYADPEKPSILTSAPVGAYGFLGSNPGAITVQGSQLAVAPGQSISLVGGNITINSGVLDNGATVQPARISAPNGQINLATAASSGEFLLQGLQSGGLSPGGINPTLLAGPNVSNASFSSFGSIHLAPGSTIDTSHTGSSRVSISGGQFVMNIENASLSTANTATPAAVGQDNVIISPGSSIFTLTSSTDLGPNVQIVADSIQAQGTLLPPSPGPAIIATQTNESSAAGNISLTSNQNIGLSFAQLVSTTGGSGTGNTGNISLSSTQGNISITSQTLVSAQTSPIPGAIGTPGTVTLNAPHGDILLDSSIVNTIIGGTGALGGTRGGIQITANNLTMRNTFNSVGITPGPGIEGDNFVNPQVPGAISITLSGNLTMDGGAVVQTVSRGPAAAAANLNITAHDVIINGTHVSNNRVFNTQLNTQTISSGQGGQLNIVADNVELTNGGQLRSGSIIGRNPLNGQPTVPSGAGGTITITGPSGPTTSVLIDGAGSGIFTNSQGTGSGGNTNITAQSVTIQNGGVINAQANASGPGGLITISTDNLQLTSGGQVTSGSVIGINPLPPPGRPLPAPTGAGGEITIQGIGGPAASVLIDGSTSGIFTNTVGSGAAGNTNITAQSVSAQNGGTISAATSGTASSAVGGTITINANQVEVNSGGLITAATTGAGAGGSVNINAGNTFNSNAGTVSSTTTGAANGGNINIAAGGSATLTNGASISASSTGQGSAGDIHINAGNFTATNSSVTTEALHSSGGIIKITTAPNGTVQLTDSTISASVLDGSGGGGSVNIDPQFVILENSQIIANSVFGPGGNINITTNLLLPDTASAISASSQFGQQGNIVIQSPISPASGKIVPLSQRPLIATTLLSQRCAALAGGNASSFTVAGRDSLPAEPGGWVSSPLALTAPAAADEALQASDENGTEQRIDAPVVSVRKIAPAGFLTQSFAGSTDCAS